MDEFSPWILDDLDEIQGFESRLWENDSSYLIAVAPHVYENNRIRLKVILGYRAQSQVHGLPQSGNVMTSSDRRYLLPQRYDRYRASSYGGDLDDMTGEQFERLSEHEQRRILREKYLRKTWNQGNILEDVETVDQNQYRNMSSLQSLTFWAIRNLDRMGWKSILGILAFLIGIYKTSGG